MKQKSYKEAIFCLKKRIVMKNPRQWVNAMEVYHSPIHISFAQKELNYSTEIFTKLFFESYLYRPIRGEALPARLCRITDNKTYGCIRIIKVQPLDIE
jgi:hypothetical protein